MITKQQLERVTNNLERYAQEAIEVEVIKGSIYAFGSEVATLRILKHYRYTDNAKSGYSTNLQRFYFELEREAC